MANVVEREWADLPVRGLAVCPYGHGMPLGRIELLEAAHPVPDQNSVDAATRVIELAETVGAGDLLLVLLSGGGSSLLCAPVDGLNLRDKQALTTALLKSGGNIQEINEVRSFYSRIKGGGLLDHPDSNATVVTLAISDVVGDDISRIASGPTVRSEKNLERIREISQIYALPLHDLNQLPKTGGVLRSSYSIIGNAAAMLTAAKSWLVDKGYYVNEMGAEATGEARDVAKEHVNHINEFIKGSARKKVAFLSGGELTVTVNGKGAGGPNQEYLLAVMSLLEPGCFSGFAADTDGCDGVGGAAGAFFCPDIHMRSQVGDMCAEALRQNSSCNFFKQLGGRFEVSPSFTNVNDLRVVLYEPARAKN